MKSKAKKIFILSDQYYLKRLLYVHLSFPTTLQNRTLKSQNLKEFFSCNTYYFLFSQCKNYKSFDSVKQQNTISSYRF